MKLSTALRLGRVSNLPTVWTNVLAGLVLAGGEPEPVLAVLLVVAGSMFYVGGMYLNDAFDAEIDAAERPERPIPSGEVSRTTVLGAGFAWLLAGLGLVAWASLTRSDHQGSWAPTIAGLGTCALIVLYNLRHKGNPFAPVIMGLCRVGLYVMAGLAAGPSLPADVWWGCLLLLGYVLGLTYVAASENHGTLGRSWPLAGLFAPSVYMILGPKTWLVRAIWAGFGIWVMRALDFIKRGQPDDMRTAVVSLIAGISLLDAMLIARAGYSMYALAAVGAFGITVALQRKIAGT